MTNKPTLTREQARSLIEQAVEAKGPDYVYEQPAFFYDDDAGQARPIPAEEYDPDNEDHYKTCAYVAGGAPSCLVGHVLHMAGVPLDALSVHEETAAAAMVADVVDADEAVIDALDAAQKKQDGGHTWNEALRAFNYTLALHEAAEEVA